MMFLCDLKKIIFWGVAKALRKSNDGIRGYFGEGYISLGTYKKENQFSSDVSVRYFPRKRQI